jgi:selenocysteine-specific elongation factor
LAEVQPRPLTIGTAGHIDHGKTALVRALTGRDTDRLAEEQRRGMSIELGFAELDLGERRLSLVDVPGHERFVRTMIAGASGIDMFLLVVAADDGPMPQTREHLAVLRALGVEAGAIALSKVDLVGAERRRLAAEQCRQLAPGLPLVEISARSGEGLERLRATLAGLARKVDEAVGDDAAAGGALDPNAGDVVLHVDRAFTIAGHGTVVTGTLWSGRIERGQRIVLLPAGRQARVRSIEVHDRRLEVATPHQRVALNLGGIGRGEVRRGDVVAAEDAAVAVTYRLDAELLVGAAAVLAERRVQIHLGTRESPARVVDLGDGKVQLRLEAPLLARRGDRAVVRRIAPPDTLGGILVGNPAPPRHGPGWTAPPRHAPSRETGGEKRDELAVKVASAATVPPPEPSPLALRLLAELEADGLRPRGATQLSEASGAGRREVERALGELNAAGLAVRVQADVFYPAPLYERLSTAILAQAEREDSISLAEARDALGISRKYAQALLEHLDRSRALRREGDRHYPWPGARG